MAEKMAISAMFASLHMYPYRLADRVYEGFSAGEAAYYAGDFHYQRVAAGDLPVDQQFVQPTGYFLGHDQHAAVIRKMQGIGQGETGGLVPALGDSPEDGYRLGRITYRQPLDADKAETGYQFRIAQKKVVQNAARYLQEQYKQGDEEAPQTNTFGKTGIGHGLSR